MLATNSAVMPRLDRGIKYAAAHRLNHSRLGVLDRPVKPGDDGGVLGLRSHHPGCFEWQPLFASLPPRQICREFSSRARMSLHHSLVRRNTTAGI
ncbi:hypothetical protein [Bradyrhizobium sp. CCGB01]|uniref:hypothetical protein n=1 Tax=Bradyrhizobium sp. CCGB01 TaxID=2949634 RepID=UPI0020B3D3B7|nr:hypothetical protein [Bradyrhizobium sp. CCGB01]MCP3405953.1 hypothetical protein [Bradyrhizobium sp. CCGB01]